MISRLQNTPNQHWLSAAQNPETLGTHSSEIPSSLTGGLIYSLQPDRAPVAVNAPPAASQRDAAAPALREWGAHGCRITQTKHEREGDRRDGAPEDVIHPIKGAVRSFCSCVYAASRNRHQPLISPGRFLQH